MIRVVKKVATALKKPLVVTRVAKPKLPLKEAIKTFKPHVIAAADQYGFKHDWALRQVTKESTWNPYARSPYDAYGLMQLRPAAAHDMKVNRYDPIQNIYGGFKYMAWCRNQVGGNEIAGLAAYNMGLTEYLKYKRNGWELPTETKNYIAYITTGKKNG